MQGNHLKTFRRKGSTESEREVGFPLVNDTLDTIGGKLIIDCPTNVSGLCLPAFLNGSCYGSQRSRNKSQTDFRTTSFFFPIGRRRSKESYKQSYMPSNVASLGGHCKCGKCHLCTMVILAVLSSSSSIP